MTGAAAGPSRFAAGFAIQHIKTNAWNIARPDVARTTVRRTTIGSVQVVATPGASPFLG
jgi:hypothetical protein